MANEVFMFPSFYFLWIKFEMVLQCKWRYKALIIGSCSVRTWGRRNCTVYPYPDHFYCIRAVSRNTIRQFLYRIQIFGADIFSKILYPNFRGWYFSKILYPNLRGWYFFKNIVSIFSRLIFFGTFSVQFACIVLPAIWRCGAASTFLIWAIA